MTTTTSHAEFMLHEPVSHTLVYYWLWSVYVLFTQLDELRNELESTQAKLAVARKEADAERERFKKIIQELKKKLDRSAVAWHTTNFPLVIYSQCYTLNTCYNNLGTCCSKPSAQAVTSSLLSNDTPVDVYTLNIAWLRLLSVMYASFVQPQLQLFCTSMHTARTPC